MVSISGCIEGQSGPTEEKSGESSQSQGYEESAMADQKVVVVSY